MGGNLITAAATSNNFTIDNTPATITAGSAIGIASNGAEYFIDLTFSNDVYGNSTASAAPVFANVNAAFLANGGTATGITPVGLTRIGNPSFSSSIPLTGGEVAARFFFNVDGTAAGVETVALTPATATSIFDLAGNPVDIAQTSGTKTLKDETAPVISAIAVNTKTDGSVFLKSGDVATITFHIAELGGITATPTVVIGDALVANATISGVPVAGDYTYTYNVGANNYSNLKVTVSATDNAGLNSSLTLNPAFTIDNIRPEVQSITRNNVTNGTNYLTNDDAVSFTVTFTEPVLNFDLNDITLNPTGTVNNPDIVVTPVSTSVYTVTLGGCYSYHRFG